MPDQFYSHEDVGHMKFACIVQNYEQLTVAT